MSLFVDTVCSVHTFQLGITVFTVYSPCQAAYNGHLTLKASASVLSRHLLGQKVPGGQDQFVPSAITETDLITQLPDVSYLTNVRGSFYYTGYL